MLGWGGYWGWDPVENASLLPWLTGTAFLHSVMMQEKRGMMKMWNMWLIFTTFLLAIFGTFLTRSGVVSSVHAFAQSGIGIWFVWFLAIAFATCVFFFVRNRETLKSEHRLDSLVSRESSFLFNNLVLLVACFAVLWGTLFPVLSEWVHGHQGHGRAAVLQPRECADRIVPVVPDRRRTAAGVAPDVVGQPEAQLPVADDYRSGDGHRADRGRHAAVAGQRVLLFADGDLAVGAGGGDDRREFWRGGRVIARQQHINILSGMVQITRRNTRRYGGYIVHFGVILIMIGFAGLPFNQDKEQELGFGDKMQIGGYTLVCQSYTQDDTPNYGSEWAVSMCTRTARRSTPCIPERRFYKASEQTSTIVANRSRPNEDLYLVYTGQES